MPKPEAGRGRGLMWAIIGSLVLAVAIIAIVLTSLFARTPGPNASEQPSQSSTPSPQPTDSPAQQFVDESVTASGWIPEPITTDPDIYIRAALSAASTFDTQKSTRSDWLTYLDTWFTPDTRYTSEEDRDEDMQASQLELRQAVVLPEEEWDSLANEDGRVAAGVPGEIMYSEVPDDASGYMRIGTADVVLTFTHSDGSGGETTYDETVRVSVQVLCGEGSIPTPDSAQQPGECKVVRYFSGSLEP
jgi:hypothetical protein